MKGTEPGSGHRWLLTMVGEWTGTGQAEMKPGEAPVEFHVSESVRSLGDLWTVAEGRGPGDDGRDHLSLMTLGYDPGRNRFVGTFVASMATHLWVYEGSLDGNGRVLTLDTRGPDMSGLGMASYQDIIELVSDDERTLTSRMRATDGAWRQVVSVRYRRRP